MKRRCQRWFTMLLMLTLVLSLPAAASAEYGIFCPNCGRQISSISKFCMYCGAEIEQYRLPGEKTDRIWCNIVDVVAEEGFTAGLRADGTVAYTGNDFSGVKEKINSWTDIERIETQGPWWGSYLIGYRKDGGIRIEPMFERKATYYSEDVWEETDFASWKDIRQLYIGYACCLGLRKNGTVAFVSVDAETEKSIRSVSTWSGIEQLAFHDAYSLVAGLKSDGTVVTTDKAVLSEEGSYWGSSWGDESNWNGIQKLIGNAIGIYAVRSDGTVLGMQRPGWTNIDSLYFAYDSMFGLRRDGTVATDFSEYYNEEPGLIEISGWKNIIALGFDYTDTRYLPVGLCKDGTVRAFTAYSSGEKYGEWDFSGWSHIRELYSGADYTIGVREDGTVLVTGGEFDTLDYLNEISRWTGITKIVAAHGEKTGHIVGLKEDGTVVAAGDNSFGQCDVYH